MRNDKILPCVLSVGPDAGGRRCGIHQVILSSTSLATIQSCCRFFAHLPIFRQMASVCEKPLCRSKSCAYNCSNYSNFHTGHTPFVTEFSWYNMRSALFFSRGWIVLWALFQKIIRESAEDIHSALQGWVSILEWFDYERMFLGYYLQSKSYPFSLGRTKKKALELHVVRAVGWFKMQKSEIATQPQVF